MSTADGRKNVCPGRRRPNGTGTRWRGSGLLRNGSNWRKRSAIIVLPSKRNNLSPKENLKSAKPPGFILPCQPALADRPPSRPGWQHEIKWDGYRVIARKDGEQVRLWARTTSDYSKSFTRIRDAVAALPAEKAVIDGEAVLPRADGSFDFEGLRSREGQAAAMLIAYDVLEVHGQDNAPRAPGSAQKAPGGAA
jgi:ATP-dependent DNA ligase